MTRFLASVDNLADALLVADLGADIVDLKQPSQGALGALNVDDVSKIVTALNANVEISATVGDLQFLPEVIIPAVAAMLETGVDFVKIGLFPGGNIQASLDALAQFTANNHKLIAVLFADTQLDLQLLPALAEAKFSGVMLDTMHKSSGRLMDLLSLSELSAFVATAKAHHLLTGLAGSLKVQDIPLLLEVNPDYLGFRGALCRDLKRTNSIDPAHVSHIRQLIVG